MVPAKPGSKAAERKAKRKQQRADIVAGNASAATAAAVTDFNAAGKPANTAPQAGGHKPLGGCAGGVGG